MPLWRTELSVLLRTYTAAETHSAFHWAEKLPKLPSLVKDLDPIYYIVSLANPSQMGSRSAIFSGLTNVTNRQTDRHTEVHATPCVSIGRI